MKKRVHEMELNRTSVQMVLAERFPGAFDKRVPDMVQDNRQKLMVRFAGCVGNRCCHVVFSLIAHFSTSFLNYLLGNCETLFML